MPAACWPACLRVDCVCLAGWLSVYTLTSTLALTLTLTLTLTLPLTLSLILALTLTAFICQLCPRYELLKMQQELLRRKVLDPRHYKATSVDILNAEAQGDDSGVV